jgi:hypothetical protein
MSAYSSTSLVDYESSVGASRMLVTQTLPQAFLVCVQFIKDFFSNIVASLERKKLIMLVFTLLMDFFVKKRAAN